MARPSFVSGDALNASGFQTNTATISLAVGTGTNRVCFAEFGGDASGASPASATFDGNAMTLVQAWTLQSRSMALYYYAIADGVTGTKNIIGTMTSGDTRPGIAAAIWQDAAGSPRYSGVTTAGNGSFGTSHSLTVTSSAANGLAVVFGHNDVSVAPAASAGTTKRAGLSSAGFTQDWLFEKDGAGSTTLNWTTSSGDVCSRIGFSIDGVASAPVLTSPAGAATGNTTASGTVNTTGTDGTLYAVRSAAQPTNTQIVAGQDSAGAASSAGSLAITTSGSKTVPMVGVAVPTGSQTVWFLHRPASGAGSDSNVTSATWTQPTAPVLSSPTNTPGSTTALIGATTTVSSGTAYFLARVGGSAASAATIIATGQNSTVTTTTPSRTVTGLTASTANNFVDIVQVSGVTTSNVVSTGAFTTTASGDTTPPTLTGSIVIGTVTSSSIQMSWSAGSDNVAVTSYEVSSNGGSGYVDAGNVLTYTFTGLTASTSYGLRVRAKDAAGNVSTPALAATQSTAAASGVGSISLNNAALYTFKTNNGTVIASTGLTFYVHNVNTGALIGSAITGLSTNASGVVTTAISNASMLAGTQYRLVIESSTGKYGSIKLTAV